MTRNGNFIVSSVFLLFFLLLTPLGVFNEWIPPLTDKGYYSVTQIDEGDDAGYYAFLRSAFFDGDIDFINELNYVHVENFNDTGYVFNHWQIGQSILFLPFFLAGHVHALILNGLGYPIAADGYSEPYHLWTAIASQTYVFIGLLVLYRLLRKYYNPGPALLAVLASWLASPLVYYTFIRQRMAHGSEFFLSVIFVAVWLHYRESRDVRHHAIMGAVLGFLCITRLVGACYFFLYLVDLLYQGLSNKNEALPVLFKGIVARLGSFSLLLLIVFLPQVYVWNQLDGSIVSYVLSIFDRIQGSAGSVESSVKIYERFIEFFFTGNWTLSLSSPAWFLGLIATVIWPPLIKKNLRFGWMAFLLVLFLLLFTAGGEEAAYGSRLITLGCPLFAFGLAAILQKASSRFRLYLPTFAFFVFCILLQYLMIVQYKVSLAYNDPNYTIKALGAIPILLISHPELLLRSTNFVRLIFLDNPNAWDYQDVLFLIVFPLSQLVCLALVLYSQVWVTRWKGRFNGIIVEKVFVGGVVFATCTLIILVGTLAPTKTIQEKSNREKYSVLMKKGDSSFSNKEMDKAIVLFTEAYKLVPEIIIPLYKVALAFEEKNEIQMANIKYRQLLVRNPYHGFSLLNLGDNLRSLGNYEEAEYYFKASIRRNPYNEKTFNSFGVTYAKQNNLKGARKKFETAVALKPNYGIAHLNLALLETMVKNSPKAIGHLKMAIKMGVKNPLVSRLSKFYKLEEGGG